jgi:hypothetical protein
MVKKKELQTLRGTSAMNTTPPPPPSRAELAAKLTRELMSLRDALVSLSLSLKDWQFELDENGRQVSQKAAFKALEKFRLHAAPGNNTAANSRSPAAGNE